MLITVYSGYKCTEGRIFLGTDRKFVAVTWGISVLWDMRELFLEYS